MQPGGGVAGDYAPGSWGGHSIPVLSYDEHLVYCITWGAVQAMTWAWLAAYCDEMWAIVAHDWLNKWGKSPALKLNVNQLRADMKAVA